MNSSISYIYYTNQMKLVFKRIIESVSAKLGERKDPVCLEVESIFFFNKEGNFSINSFKENL